MQRSGAVVLAIVVALGGLAWADAARTPKQVEADKLFAEGRALLETNPKAACEKFELAATADPTAAGTMLNLGKCYEKLGRTHAALRWYRRAETTASEAGLPDHEEAAKKMVAELLVVVPVIAIDFNGARPIDPTDVHVRIDGEDIPAVNLAHVEVDPGDHVIAVRTAHRKVAHRHITATARAPKHDEILAVTIGLEEGEPTMIVDKGRQRRFVAYGLGVAALGAWTFDFFYGVHESRLYHCAADVGKMCAETDALVGAARTNYANDRVTALQYTGTTVFVLGAAALAAGAYLFFTAPGKVTVDQVGNEHVSIAPLLGPSQVGFAVTGGF